MLSRVAVAWPSLRRVLGSQPAEAPPRVIHEVHGAQAMVSRARITDRPADYWRGLRDHARRLEFHSDADYAMEAAFHVAFGEPWSRPFVVRHLQELLRGRASELEIRCGVPPLLVPDLKPEAKKEHAK